MCPCQRTWGPIFVSMHEDKHHAAASSRRHPSCWSRKTLAQFFEKKLPRHWEVQAGEFLYTQALFYTHTFCHTDASAHRHFHTQIHLPTGTFHKDLFAHRRLYTHVLSHRWVYTQTLLHTDTFTHRPFDTKTLLHTDVFTHKGFAHKQRRFDTQRPDTQTRLHTYDFI